MNNAIRYAVFLFVFGLTVCDAQQKDQLEGLTELERMEVGFKDKVNYLLQRAWVANMEPSYASVLPFIPSIDERRIPLEQGEGANSDFSLIEANINLSFPLFFGKPKGWRVNQRHMFTFDYNGNFRMSLDDSKPILPGNNKVGFSWYIALHNNFTRGIFKDNKVEEKINFKPDNLKFWNLLIQAHHYSNGQAPGFFFVPNEENPDFKRNSYRDGDFSTNYFYGQLTRGWYNKLHNSLHQFSLGYRLDLGTEESTFAFSKEQEDAYGKNRAIFKYDYRTERLQNKMAYHFRVETEYIIGNLDDFVPNLALAEGNDNKYRFAIRGFFEMSPNNHRSIGYFVSIYYGRDYMNIRYDDIIYSTQFGVTLSLDKFFMPKLNYD